MLYLNGQPLSVTIFPDNTSQVWKIPNLENIIKDSTAVIRWTFSTENEFMHLAQLKHLLGIHGVECDLIITYLPYGRQDKPVANNATFALRTFAYQLNTLEFSSVTIIDPHSQIAIERINNSKAIYPVKELIKIIDLVKPDTLCYPDKGAVSKYSKIYDFPHIFGEKVRDQLTGKITAYTLYGECYRKNILIVDDICDYGNTFILLTKDLLAAGAKEVNLFVSHGLFSGGLRPLKNAGINKIFTPEGEAISDRVRSPM